MLKKLLKLLNNSKNSTQFEEFLLEESMLYFYVYKTEDCVCVCEHITCRSIQKHC